MQVINVVKAFVLTLADGARHEIAAGVQEVEDFVADHWYTKAHTAPVPDVLTKAAVADKGKKAAAQAPATGDGAVADAKSAVGDTTDNAAAQ
ncbi:STY1053 family phage-associated protein [Chromobacterium violaceum]|uniref:STY1053 family phage-associated protein n=1 Tax=Chromobacterium violaceum TaxID=536 RepID=UPI00068978E3|nr:hypothetical protein [Chromobacterium violaceum]